MIKANRKLERLKGTLNRSQNFYDTFNLTRRIIQIFIEYDDKEAEEILADLLNHENEAIRFLALCALQTAENQEKVLDYKTEIKVIQFRNNPVNIGLCEKLDSSLKAEESPFN